METTLKPHQVKQALKACLRANRPFYLWGGPGIGKSDVVKQTGEEMNLTVQDVRAVLLDPVDLRGLPHVNGDGRAHWAVPDFLPRDGEGILFLDELNRAPVLVQNACFQLILDRQLGEYYLPDGWRIGGAGNRMSDGGGITPMSPPLANRFVHLEMEVNLEDWTNWAAGHDVEPIVIAFLRFKSQLLHNFDRNAHAFPTPRSWQFVSDVVKQHERPDIEMALVAGAVGDGAAIEFEAFIRLYQKLPNIDALLLNPTQAPVPTDSGTLYAITSTLGFRADVSNFARVIQYLDRLPSEYSVFAMKDAITRDAKLQNTPEFTRWAIAHAELM